MDQLVLTVAPIASIFHANGRITHLPFEKVNAIQCDPAHKYGEVVWNITFRLNEVVAVANGIPANVRVSLENKFNEYLG